MKKNPLSVRALIVGCVSLLIGAVVWSTLLAQELKPPGVVIWDGEITISRQASAEYTEDNGESGGVFFLFEKRRVDDVTVIRACGAGPLLTVYSAERSLWN
jgi:hypothetical protein